MGTENITNVIICECKIGFEGSVNVFWFLLKKLLQQTAKVLPWEPGNGL